MNETSKRKQLNCYLISGALVKNKAKQKNKPSIFRCQRNSDKDPTSQRGPEIKDYSIKYVFLFKREFLVLLMQGSREVVDWQPWSLTFPKRELGANKSLAHKAHLPAKHPVPLFNPWNTRMCWYTRSKQPTPARKLSEVRNDGRYRKREVGIVPLNFYVQSLGFAISSPGLSSLPELFSGSLLGFHKHPATLSHN